MIRSPKSLVGVHRTYKKPKMINMDQKEQILHYHRVDGLSLREISRSTGVNRKTETRHVRALAFTTLEDLDSIEAAQLLTFIREAKNEKTLRSL